MAVLCAAACARRRAVGCGGCGCHCGRHGVRSGELPSSARREERGAARRAERRSGHVRAGGEGAGPSARGRRERKERERKEKERKEKKERKKRRKENEKGKKKWRKREEKWEKGKREKGGEHAPAAIAAPVGHARRRSRVRSWARRAGRGRTEGCDRGVQMSGSGPSKDREIGRENGSTSMTKNF